MKVLIVSQSEISQLLPMQECIELMAEALRALSRGEALVPLRQVLWLPEMNKVLGVMPSYLGSIGAMGVKVISVFPGNLGTEFDSHQGAVLLFETQNGRLLAIMDATEITAIRTAAVSGVATRLLAREDAADLAVLGSGVQARMHLEAMLLARTIKRVRVWSRNREHAREFAERESQHHNIGINFADTAQKAVEGAGIVCTVTSSRTPVLQGEWLIPGVHVNAVGGFGPTSRELDSMAVASARLFVDRRESAMNESGDFLIPKAEGIITDDHICGELGDLLLGKVQGRTSNSDRTVFKSLGLAIEDLASAHHIYKRALERNMGTMVELGGSRHGAD